MCDVNRKLRIEMEDVLIGLQHINAGSAQAPGAKIASRSLVVAARPQRPRRMPAADSAAIQNHFKQFTCDDKATMCFS
jgi:hypothetical protein